MMKDKEKTLFYSYMCVLLIIFFLKILGVKGFELACDNKNVIMICNFIDRTFLKYICQFIMYVFTTAIVIQSILGINKFKGKQNYIYLIIGIAEILRLIFINLTVVVLLIDLFFTLVLPIIIDKKLVLKAIIVNIIILVFQFISFFVKELSIYEHTIDNTLTAIIYSLDYLIMLLLLRDFISNKIISKKEK